MKKILVILGIMILIGTIYQVFIEYRFHYKPVINFMIEHFVTDSCNGKKGCDEIRVLPKVLQNKKIVFKPDVLIFFNPYSRNVDISMAELDTIGFLDSDNFKRYEIVNPILEKTGYLENREYKIIRAVYHYNCSYCIDSDDYSYITIEDIDGNRFISLLDHTDSSKDPWENLSWDKYLPYYLTTNNDMEPEAILVDL